MQVVISPKMWMLPTISIPIRSMKSFGVDYKEDINAKGLVESDCTDLIHFKELSVWRKHLGTLNRE